MDPAVTELAPVTMSMREASSLLWIICASLIAGRRPLGEFEESLNWVMRWLLLRAELNGHSCEKAPSALKADLKLVNSAANFRQRGQTLYFLRS